MIGTTKQLLKPLVERVPPIARAYRFLRDRWDFHRSARSTPYGFRFVGNRTVVHGRYEPTETATAQELLRKCDVFINVGANRGYYCCLAANQSIQTIAIEPDSLNNQYLMKNLILNKFEQRVELIPVAVSSEPGIAQLYGTASGASLIEGWSGIHPYNRRLVPVNTLDNLISDRFYGRRCFVLVDIEGHEFSMLQGAKKLLDQEPRPIWIVEIHKLAHQPLDRIINPHLKDTFEMFWSRGYDSWTVELTPRPVLPDLIEKICSEKVDVLGVHNFLFAQKGISR